MKELISLHIGQAGIQIGNNCWELFCLEDNIQCNGFLNNSIDNNNISHSCLFNEHESGKYIPRCCFIDLEPSVIDEIKHSKYSDLYNSNQLISGKEDSGNVFSRGRYTIGYDYIDTCLNQIQKLSEQCSNLEGFLLYNSIGGGTGSGFTSLLLQKLANIYNKKTIIDFCIYPSPHLSSSSVEPYNAILSSNYLINHTDITIMFNNEALYNINNTYKCKNINHIIAQVASSLTCPLRYNGILNYNINELYNNIVPSSKYHFVSCCNSSSIINEDKKEDIIRTQNITNKVFHPNNRMITCNPKKGKYITCNLLYRGNHFTQKEIHNAIYSLKDNKYIQFSNNYPAKYNCNISFKQQTQINNNNNIQIYDKSLCMISNNTSIANIFKQTRQNYNKLIKTNAFVHWFIGDGLEYSEFNYNNEILKDLEKEYKDLEI